MTVSLPFSGVWCSHSHLRNLLLCNWCKLLNGSNLDQVFYSSPQNHLRLSSDLCQLQTMIWWILMLGSTGVLSFGSLSPSSLSSLSWRVGLEVLWWNKSPLVAWVLYHTLNSIFIEGWSLWVKRSGGSLDVWITLDTFDWGGRRGAIRFSFGTTLALFSVEEQVQSRFATASPRQSSLFLPIDEKWCTCTLL